MVLLSKTAVRWCVSFCIRCSFHHYETLVRYMEWQDIGKVLAIGCGSRPIIERTEFPNQAYQIGYNL